MMGMRDRNLRQNGLRRYLAVHRSNSCQADTKHTPQSGNDRTISNTRCPYLANHERLRRQMFSFLTLRLVLLDRTRSVFSPS